MNLSAVVIAAILVCPAQVEPVPVESLTDLQLIGKLDSKDDAERKAAIQALSKRVGYQFSTLLSIAENKHNAPRARLGAWEALRRDRPLPFFNLFADLIRSNDPRVRLATIDFLEAEPNSPQQNRLIHKTLVNILDDPDQTTRRAIMRAMGRVNAAGGEEDLVHLAKFKENKDPLFWNDLAKALDGYGEAGVRRLLTLADSGDDNEIARLVDIYLRLQSRESFELMPLVLKSYHVEASDKVRIIERIRDAKFDPPLDLGGLEKYLVSLNDPDNDTRPKKAEDRVPVFLIGWDVLARAGRITDVKLREHVQGLMKSDPETTLQALPQFAFDLTSRVGLAKTPDLYALGDSTRGRDLLVSGQGFRCLNCHQVQGHGNGKGADLKGFKGLALDDFHAMLFDPKHREKTKMPKLDASATRTSDLLDLAAFARDPDAQRAWRGLALSWWVVGPFSADLTQQEAPERNPDPESSYRIAGVEEKLTWQKKHGDGLGMISTGVNAKSSAYALTYVHATEAGKFNVRIEGNRNVALWVNGVASALDGPADLQKGWNTLLVRVVGPRSFSLKILDADHLRWALSKTN